MDAFGATRWNMTSEILKSILLTCKDIDVIASKLYTKISHMIEDRGEK
jgi:hypothetical protein